MWLTPAASRLVFHRALRELRQEGGIALLERLLEWPGYRKELRERIRRWTEAETASPLARGSVPGDPEEAVEARVFARYRELLGRLNAEDDAGMAVWASKRMARRDHSGRRPLAFRTVVILDFDQPTPAQWRALRSWVKQGCSVEITLPFEEDVSASELYVATEVVRARLLELGLTEQRLELPSGRPAGLGRLEQSLFRSTGEAATPIQRAEGIAIRGVPEGEGVARQIACEVGSLLQRGVPAERILVLFRRWDHQAELVSDLLGRWGLPVSSSRGTPLASNPALIALRQAVGLPLAGWKTDLLVGLLRNGQFQPSLIGGERDALPIAASIVKQTPVFRGRDQLLRGLDQALLEAESEGMETESIVRSRRVVQWLIDLLDPLDRPRAWTEQFEVLRRTATELGIENSQGTVLEPLWELLEDESAVRKLLGEADQVWAWADFLRDLDEAIDALPPQVARSLPGAVRITTVDQAVGARADHIILAGLGEGTFPVREAVESFLDVSPLRGPTTASLTPYSREMIRFLRVIGSAEAGLVLVYPTTDSKGQELLRAGFLEEVLSLLAPEAQTACHVASRRLHPALLDRPDLAVSPGDLRVLAASRAAEKGELHDLARLSAIPEHREALEGTAAALFALSRRSRGTRFGAYDGVLQDPAAVRAIAQQFGPSYRFSPSQLETYIECPFRFHCRHVLKLSSDEPRDELGEDLTERGSRLHHILEILENIFQSHPPGPEAEALAMLEVERQLGREAAPATELEQGLQEIERQLLLRILSQYFAQRQHYETAPDPPFVPYRMEVPFGEDRSPIRELEIRHRGRTLMLRGRIDRIDVAETESGKVFRVIDYKSGSTPSSNDVKGGTMIQLPLYAMAVEQLLLEGDRAELFDLGYWSLRGDGFKPIAFEDWDRDQRELAKHVISQVDQICQGVFPVHSIRTGCEQSCEFRAVCRVRQVRTAGKQRRLQLPVLSVRQRRGRNRGVARGIPGDDSRPAVSSAGGNE